MREFVLSAEMEGQISRLPTESKDQFKLEKEQHHAIETSKSTLK